MPRYEIVKRGTLEGFALDAPFLSMACARLGWEREDCLVLLAREGWHKSIGLRPQRLETADARQVYQRLGLQPPKIRDDSEE